MGYGIHFESFYNSDLVILIEDYMKKAKQEDRKRLAQDHQDNHEENSEPKAKRNPHFGKMFTPCV